MACFNQSALFDTAQKIADQFGFENPPAHGFEMRIVGQQGRGDCSDIQPMGLHGQNRSAVADMPVHNLALD